MVSIDMVVILAQELKTWINGVYNGGKRHE